MNLCLAVSLALGARASAAEENSSGENSSGNPVIWWVEPAARKVFQDSPPGALKEIKLAAARGEWESAQIVLQAPESDADVTVPAAAAVDLTGPDGVARPGAIELRRVGFVPVPYAGKAWPDPLVPIDGKGHLVLKKGENVPFLVTVRVPRDAPPGLHRSEIYMSTMKRPHAIEGSMPVILQEKIPVSVHVYPFEIPEKPSVKTAFGLSMDYALHFEGLKPGTPEARALHEKYYELLLEHRISPYEIPVDILDPGAAKFLDDSRVTSFQIPFRDDIAWVKARVDRCREKGWLDRAYFYPWDEPVTEEQYASLRAAVEKIHSIDSKLRIVSPFYRDSQAGKSAYDALDGLVSIWCSVSAYFNPARMEDKRKAGGEVWWYVCCGPGEPYANLHLTMDGMAHRILPWQMALHRIEGFLYWSTTYWNPTHLKDPWEDMVTVPDINKKLSGDGSLMYPSRRAAPATAASPAQPCRVAQGPVPSLRLLLLRDGFEDLEYLACLEKAAGCTAVEEAVKKLTPDLTHFSKDPAELEKVRREIAERISAAGAKEP